QRLDRLEQAVGRVRQGQRDPVPTDSKPVAVPLIAMDRKRVVVSGRVQGVFFRDTCRRMAVRAGVSGWVRNRADGRVEAGCEGPAEAVDLLVNWARRGPSGAVVTGVDVHAEEPERLTGFAIR